MRRGYLVIDVGTGNTKAAIVTCDGQIISEHVMDTKYIYEDDMQCHFSPEKFWEDILHVVEQCLAEAKDIHIMSITSTSIRQGIILLDEQGKGIIGLPNIDNRGAYLESRYDKEYIYNKTGKWAARYFSAFKLVAYLESHPATSHQVKKIVSISDWIGYKFTGVLKYEHTQACETLLYDMATSTWSKELCELFGVDYALLPELVESAAKLGCVSRGYSYLFQNKDEINYIVSSADTQVAAFGIGANVGDTIIIAGTTTPIISITKDFMVDKRKRCWSNRYIYEHTYVLEVNAGVTGLNYQRFKHNCLQSYTYEALENRYAHMDKPKVLVCLSTLDFATASPTSNGTIQLETPIDASLDMVDFAYGIILDMVCGIRRNLDVLADINGIIGPIIGVGGGLRSPLMCQLIADLTQKPLLIYEGYEQGSIRGCVLTCNKYNNVALHARKKLMTYTPKNNHWIEDYFVKWCNVREKSNESTDS